MRLVLFGPPCSGKGTQAARLAGITNVPHISTGDILRKAIHEQTPLGKRVDDIVRRGDLVHDDLIIDLVRDHCRTIDIHQGFILDGFPRSLAQAKAFDSFLLESSLAIEAVIALMCAEKTLIARLQHRKDTQQGEQRSDDDVEVIQKRLRVYHEATEPLLAYYGARKILHEVDGDKSINDVFASIKSILNL